MDDELRWIAEATGARTAQRRERIQSLWSGYGELFRVSLEGAAAKTAVVKRIAPPRRRAAEDRSHARKLRSYEVETAWYRSFAKACDETCRVPALLASRTDDDRTWLVLEDLDGAGFSKRTRSPSAAELEACLAWLAAFHARFLGEAPASLWPSGTYWHLATRPDELAAIESDALREAAPTLDRLLRDCRFQTFVHGDAKLANFCFAGEKASVAAVDFQYVGGGCGMKDVAYLLAGSCGSEGRELELLDVYFAHLERALSRCKPGEFSALEREWRPLYAVACVDFYRFLAGWAKEHFRADAHAQRLVARVLTSLG